MPQVVSIFDPRLAAQEEAVGKRVHLGFHSDFPFSWVVSGVVSL